MDTNVVLENKTDFQKKLDVNLRNNFIDYQSDVYPAKEEFIAWLLEKGGPEAVALFNSLTTCEYLSTWKYRVLECKERLTESGYKLLKSKKRELALALKRFKEKYSQMA